MSVPSSPHRRRRKNTLERNPQISTPVHTIRPPTPISHMLAQWLPPRYIVWGQQQGMHICRYVMRRFSHTFADLVVASVETWPLKCSRGDKVHPDDEQRKCASIRRDPIFPFFPKVGDHSVLCSVCCSLSFRRWVTTLCCAQCAV